MEMTNQNDEENKFKCLLEYFVSHLEYAETENQNSRGFEEYIRPIDEFTRNTKGEKNYNKVQNQINNWSKYSLGDISITVSGATSRRFMGDACFLNWKHSRVNIVAEWDKEAEKITDLSIAINEVKKKGTESIRKKTLKIEELGLFNKGPVNKSFKEFFEEYKNCYQEYKKAKENEQMENIKTLLINNHNIILHGAPGTGKTYLAKDIAIDLIFGDENDRKLIREKEEEIQADEKEKYQILNTQLNEQYCFVQFHQSYDYTDFVEGLRPKDDGKGNIVFERKDGVFKEFCKKAIGAHFSNFEPAYKKFIEDLNKNNGIKLQTLKQKKSFSVRVNSNGNLYATPDTKAATDMPVTKELLKVYVETGEIKDWKPYVTAIGEYLKENYSLGDLSIDDSQKEKKYIFIIDEINRGEMSKIFGELFYSIDPGYRGIKGRIKTQYQNLIDDKHDVFVDGFYVPENVYIIGTMNDIDRSVESMDFAMRRRFAFKEITAAQSQESMFGDDEKWKKSTKKEIKPELLDRLKKRMDYLNEKILDPKYHLGQAYQIGGAYFLKFAKYYDESKKNELDAFNKLWENHIACVVKEYLRGIDDRENTLFEELKQAYQADSGINATVPAKDDDENASNAGTGAGGGN